MKFNPGVSVVVFVCLLQKACIHEIGHALGFPHEHGNPLRSSFIRINYDNIVDSKISYFIGLHFDFDVRVILNYLWFHTTLCLVC